MSEQTTYRILKTSISNGCIIIVAYWATRRTPRHCGILTIYIIIYNTIYYKQTYNKDINTLHLQDTQAVEKEN